MSDTFDKIPKTLILLAALLLIRIGLMVVNYKLYIPYLDDGLYYILQAIREFMFLANEYLSQYRQ